MGRDKVPRCPAVPVFIATRLELSRGCGVPRQEHLRNHMGTASTMAPARRPGNNLVAAALSKTRSDERPVNIRAKGEADADQHPWISLNR